MTLAELGAQLREERVGLGLSVEDLASRLKVPSRILQAIEEGRVSELPHTVYTRGFIKGYAAILGHPEERIAAMLDSLEGFEEDFFPHKPTEFQQVNARPRGCRRLLGLFFKLLLPILVAAGVWFGYVHYMEQAGEGETPEPTPSRQQDSPVSTPPSADIADNDAASSAGDHAFNPVPAPSTAENLPPPLSAQTVTTTGSAASDVSEKPAAPQPDTPEVPAPLSQNIEPTEADANRRGGQVSEADPVSVRGFVPLGPSTVPASPPADRRENPLPEGMHQIVLTADAECWVHATADNTDTREFSLQTGETFAMPFKKSLRLRLGNAGGVRITYDGQEMPAPGKVGQVKTITFPPQP